MKKHFYLLCAIIALILQTGCTSRSEVLSIKEFTALYIDSLTKDFPDDSFVQFDDATVYEISPKDTCVSSMENVYHQYLYEPDSLGMVLHNRIMTKLESEKGVSHESIFMPVIRNKTYIKSLSEQLNTRRAKQDTVIYEGYNQDLTIAYVVNTNYAMTYLNQSHLDSLGLSFDSLRRISFSNLRKLIPVVKIYGSKIFMPVVKGFDNSAFEATLLLLPDFIHDRIPVKGDAVIAVPTRDVLLVTGSDDKESISLLKAKLPQLFKGGYPISNQLYKWNGKKFERYDL